MYTIYHIPGVKIGCTMNLRRRMNEQGYDDGDYEILEVHDDIDIASRREIELQKEYGYVDKFCRTVYKQSVLNALKSNGGFKEGHTPWNNGIPHSEFTKLKISKANKGRQQSDEEKEKRRNTMLQTHRTDEYRKQQSEKIKEWWRLRKLKIA